MRRLAAVGTLVAAFAVSASAAAGILEEPPKAELATTGNDSELIDSIPIAAQPGAEERVVMSLGPDQLPRLETGDRLRVSGEVQISTTCTAPGPRCIGRPYQFNPTVVARIVLAAAPDQTASALALSAESRVRCKQQRPNRNHHCTLVMPNLETSISDLAALPCEANACYANLVVGASNRRAQPGNVIVAGADRPDASVAQDKGRLNVVQARAEVPGPSVLSSSELVNASLPLTEGNKEKRRVIHSVAIGAPRKGEVLAFDGSWLATIDHLPFNTFLNSRVIVGETPTATGPTGVARSAVQLRGDATESNGFNCTQGPSGYRSPCNVVKAGAIRITQDVVDPSTALPGTLYVNLVSAAKPLLAKKVSSAQQVQAAPSGGLTVARYPPPAAATP